VSYYTDIVVFVHFAEEAKYIDSINNWLEQHAHLPLAAMSGGDLRIRAFSTSCNHLDKGAFFAVFYALPWRSKTESFQILMREELHYYFVEYKERCSECGRQKPWREARLGD
jgi:hypothetical protein